MSDLPARLGVVGAGTMGSGIAQLGALAGIETRLHDPLPEALEKGVDRARTGFEKGAEKGRWSREDAARAASLLEAVPKLEDLAGCELVIEAAPERPDLKRELFAQLSEICGDQAVFATNTSSIPVTSLASAATRPENVVGMHFFNPAPLMRLLEVIAADQSSERALAMATATGEAMGKRVIRAQDGPGFLVNRCGRPFGAEALRLLQERVATVEQIDRICRLEGGFRMGPFELSDLVGIDVGFEVAKSFTELSFGEPRWKPNPIQARMVAAGRLGRKAGRGYYDYGDGSHRPEDPEPRAPGGGDGRSVDIAGSGALGDGLAARATAAGYSVSRSDGEPLRIDLDGSPLDGFNVLPPIDGAKLVELARGRATPATQAFFESLGFVTETVEDAPGLVLGRIVCQLVNEAMFAIGEGVGAADDVDAGMKLGLNHPRGPIEWGRAIGFGRVLATIDALYENRHEERYRAAPLLRRVVATGEGP